MIFGAGLSGGGEQRSQIAFHRGGYGPGAGHWGEDEEDDDEEEDEDDADDQHVPQGWRMSIVKILKNH